MSADGAVAGLNRVSPDRGRRKCSHCWYGREKVSNARRHEAGSPVSFPKRVGMIERRVHRCERERRSAVIERYPIDGGDDLFHLGQVVPNRRDRSKRCRTFSDVDGSDVAGPLVQILENVLVK